jgi:hypothetical protein
MKTVEKIKELYEKDYFSWTQEMVRALSEHRIEDIDFENLAEEVGDLGKAEKRALRSQFERLIAHLLKWAYTDKEGHEASWHTTIQDSRETIIEILEENPGLKPLSGKLYEMAYRHGVSWAASETNRYPDSFPNVCPWTLEQAIDSEFFPVHGSMK